MLRPGTHPARLTSLARRAELVAELGIDAFWVLPFTPDLARVPPDEFVHELLVDRLHAAMVVVGRNFTFGYRAAGDVTELERLGQRFGFAAEGVDLVADPSVALTGSPVTFSSTYVRACISAGDVRAAAEALGRPHRLEGVVVRGDQRGRELGYPTANVDCGEHAAIPADGVYACWFHHRGRKRAAATSVGTNPTFSGPRAHRRGVRARRRRGPLRRPRRRRLRRADARDGPLRLGRGAHRRDGPRRRAHPRGPRRLTPVRCPERPTARPRPPPPSGHLVHDRRAGPDVTIRRRVVGLGGRVGGADAVRRNRELQRRLYGEPLGDRLRRLLGALDVSQTVLAVALGVSSPMLSQLISGRRVKIGSPAALGRLLLLEQRSPPATRGAAPEAVARLLTEVREAEPRNDYDLLRTVAGPEELAAAAATLDPGFPSLAGLLRRAAAGG